MRVEANQNCVGFEVRVVRKVKKPYADSKFYESSGILKFLGEVLVILIN